MSSGSFFDRFRQRPVVAQPDGTFTFDFDQNLLDAIVVFANQLNDGLGEDSPSLTRLFPTAYPDDAEKDAGYQILARDQLIEGRRQAIETMTRTADAPVLTFEEISAWMGICNDLRLVLGTQLEISEDDTERLPESDPMAPTMDLYRILGYVVSDIVEALSGALDPNPGETPD